MSERECQDWQSTVYVAALDAENAAVLLQQNEDHTYALPHFTTAGGVQEITAAKMQGQIGSILQVEGQGLYRAAYEAEEALCRGEAVIVLEAQAQQKVNGDWFRLQALADITLANPAHCSLLEQVLGELETGQLRSMIAPLQRMCRKLSDYAVPDALIHGDLHGGNVAGAPGEGGQLIFFDWTDSAVSHPFFDMLLIYIAKDTAEQETMRDAYLAHWLDYEPMERLMEVWRLAEALAAVYHAISYYYILEGLENWGKNELDWGLPYWLRKILSHGEFIREH